MNFNKRNIIIFFLIIIIYCIWPVFSEDITNPEIPGVFSILSDPSGAEVFLHNTSLGSTPLIYIPNPELKVPFSLELKKAGYNDEVRNITEIPRPGNTITISTPLVLSPLYGSIKVSVKPDGSLIILNGGNPFVSPYTFEKVPIGKQIMSISKTGYKQYYNSEIQVYPGVETFLRVYLLSNTENKELVVMTTPADAGIIVDGIYRGNTMETIPLTIGPLLDGIHTVVAKMTGYKDYQIQVSTNSFNTTNLDLDMEPINSNPKPAMLRVKTDPYKTDVLLSGIWIGQTPVSGYLEFPNIAPNQRYTLSLSKEGYQNITEWIDVIAGETITIDKKLQPLLEN